METRFSYLEFLTSESTETGKWVVLENKPNHPIATCGVTLYNYETIAPYNGSNNSYQCVVPPEICLDVKFHHHGISTFSNIQLPWCQSQVWNKEEGWWWGADTATVKNRRIESNGRRRRVNRKHRDMEGKGKGHGHQHGRKPRIPEPVHIA